MKDSRKQFIKDGHAAACSEWKTKIEKEFPKLFKETDLVVGNWIKTEDCLAFVEEFLGNDFKGYGFCDNSWFESTSDWTSNVKGWTPATDKEVEAALIKEAKRRGFKEGVSFKCTQTPRIGKFGKLTYVSGNNGLYSNGTEDGEWLFRKGEWATIIETITKEEAEKELGKTII
tara:strand:- start:3271 stop:3789 length:519 start_codon:yes stop_codon:yes gene_type:complete